MFEKIMPEKKNLSIISNAERQDQPGTHWWSISNISPVSELLFFLFVWCSWNEKFHSERR